MHDQSQSIGIESKTKSMRNQKGTQTTAPNIEQAPHDLTVAKDPAPPPNKKRKQNQPEAQKILSDVGLDDQASANINQIAPGSSAETDDEQAQPEEPNRPGQFEDSETERRVYCNACLRTVERLGEAKHATQCAVKEPVSAAESAAEPSGPSRKTGRRLRDGSAEPPTNDEAPMSKPSKDEAAAAGPKPRPKAKENIKAIVERNLRKK
ncbi:MAG: hypothetical protein Q9195_008187 [Heterodermia aff. obscurata]